MNENFRNYKPGDQLRARDVNKIMDAVEALTGDSPQAGQNETRAGRLRGSTNHRPELLMVRITGIVVPESSELYDDSLSGRVDVMGETGAAAYNAVLQLWDEEARTWVDSPSGECVEVGVSDDGTDWRPLVIGSKTPVQWKKTAGKYVPPQTRETAVVMITSDTPDAEGFLSAVEVAYDSDAQSWVELGPCYVLDEGS